MNPLLTTTTRVVYVAQTLLTTSKIELILRFQQKFDNNLNESPSNIAGEG